MKTEKADGSGDSDSPNELMQPELMSKDALVSILKQRKVDIPDIENLELSLLVDLFYKNVIPLPQRKYRPNRRGQKATKQQVLTSKRKRTFDDMKGVSEFLNTSSFKSPSESSRFLCSYNIQPAGDRLKPPPSAINPDRKIIKLKSSPSSSNSSVSSKPQSSSSPIIIKTLAAKPAQKAEEKETLTKILPAKDSSNKPRTKIKLNRNSMSISSPEVSPAITTEKPNIEEKMEEQSSEKEKPAQEDESNGSVEPESPESDEAVVRKKFKAVSVKWP